MEVLSETLGDIIEPIKKILKKKPQQLPSSGTFVMLEEQIRDEAPQDLESEEEANEEVIIIDSDPVALHND